MASVTRQRSVVTLKRNLDVIRMLEDGKSLTCKELEGDSSQKANRQPKTEQAHIVSGHVIYIIFSIIVYEYNYSELWAFSHIRAPVGPMLPG